MPGGTYGVSRNGNQYPLLSVAMKAGLFHPRCRHTLTTWMEGICVAAVATILDNATGANGMLRALALGFYVANEALSLLENAGRMGVPLPRKLLDALEQVKAKTE